MSTTRLQPIAIPLPRLPWENSPSLDQHSDSSSALLTPTSLKNNNVQHPQPQLSHCPANSDIHPIPTASSQMTCSLQQPFILANPIDRTSSSLSSRIRPTPSPRNNLSFVSQAQSQHTQATPLRALPRLNSYQLSHPDSDSSRSSSLGHPGSAEFDVEDHPRSEQGSDHASSSDDEGQLTAPSTNQFHSFLTDSTTPTGTHHWIAFDTATPPLPPAKEPNHARSRSHQLSGSTSNHGSSHPKAQSVQSPGERARFLLSSSSASPPTRPILASHRSQSASRLHKITVSEHPTENPSVTIINHHHKKPSTDPPNPPLPPAIVVSSNNTNAPSSTASTLPPPSSSFSYRHQSMYELRPVVKLPSYEASLQSSPGSTRHIVSPREEEGREKLPPYSCAIHLEGWMPRKMEFKAPGVQAKDRAWKRQYVIVHGTMIRIYRSDPHAHALSASEDAYSAHFVPGPSLSADCGQAASASVGGALHFHEGPYDWAPVRTLKEAARAKAAQLPVHHNSLLRVYSLQHAESGLAADYLKKAGVVRVRANGEQFLLQAINDRAVIALIEALQAAANVALDLDIRPLPKFITLPRRRRRRRLQNPPARPDLGAHVVDAMVAEAHAAAATAQPSNADRLADMLAEEQDAYIQARV